MSRDEKSLHCLQQSTAAAIELDVLGMGKAFCHLLGALESLAKHEGSRVPVKDVASAIDSAVRFARQSPLT